MNSSHVNLSKRTALALSAALAATVLTGGAAVFGLSHQQAASAAAPVAQIVQQAPAAPAWHDSDGGYDR
jgi:hypothetical protein